MKNHFWYCCPFFASDFQDYMHNSTGYVIKQLVHAFSCALSSYGALGKLESTPEARVALGYRLGQLLRFFRALQTSRVPHNSIVHAKAWTNCYFLDGIYYCILLHGCVSQEHSLPHYTGGWLVGNMPNMKTSSPGQGYSDLTLSNLFFTKRRPWRRRRCCLICLLKLLQDNISWHLKDYLKLSESPFI